LQSGAIFRSVEKLERSGKARIGATMISEAFVLDVDGQSYQFSVFDSVEPKFDEVLIEKNIRAGKYESAPIVNFIVNSGEYLADRALADSIPFLTPF
jgi:hypothetical protein